MRKLFFSLILVIVGSGLWWALANVARFSVKKWDAKFETVLRSSLSSSGLSNQDLVSSVHEMKRDRDGEWVTHKITLQLTDSKKMNDLEKSFEESGAKVERLKQNDNPVFLVRRGNRIYQEITFVRP